MIKQLLISTLSTLLILTRIAHAQYYNSAPNYNYGSGNYYPADRNYPVYNPSSYKYSQPQKTVQNSIYDGRFTIGTDFMMNFASYKNSSFLIDSPIAGDDPYSAGTRDLRNQINALQLNVGWRILKNFGIEAFYTQSLDRKNVRGTESVNNRPEFARGEYSIYYKAYGIDLLGYSKVNDYIDFITTIGVGKYDTEAKMKVVAYTDNSHNAVAANIVKFLDSSVGYRIGGGFQFWLSRHIALRLMGRWTSLRGDFMRYITEVNAGIRYHFN